MWLFHLAAAVGVQKIIQEPINTIEINIGGTETLLKACRRYRKKILIAVDFRSLWQRGQIPISGR